MLGEGLRERNRTSIAWTRCFFLCKYRASFSSIVLSIVFETVKPLLRGRVVSSCWTLSSNSCSKPCNFANNAVVEDLSVSSPPAPPPRIAGDTSSESCNWTWEVNFSSAMLV